MSTHKKYPSVREQMSTAWYIFTMEYYSPTTRRNERRAIPDESK